MQQIQYANGVTTDYNYDVRGRPTQIHTQKNGNDLLNLAYTFDAVENILQMKNTENVNGQQIIKEQWDYTYDSLNRLKTATGGPPGQNYLLNYQYDNTGNRIQLNNTLYAYNEMNELISAGSEGNTLTFTYDEYGNCTEKSDGTKMWEYVYDFENRLTAVKVDGTITEQYEYDGDGKRIKKVDSQSATVYVYSSFGVLYEKDLTSQMDAVYIYGPEGRIAKRVNDIQEYYHTDHLGSTRVVTSELGTLAEEIQYEPFGEEINATEEKYTYNGKERDETGLYYYGARYYDPEVGRFLTRDYLKGEHENPQSLNLYSYCLNNPLRYTDPVGLEEDDGKDPDQIAQEIFNMLTNLSTDFLGQKIEGEVTLELLKDVLEALGFKVDNLIGKDGTLDGLSIKWGDDSVTIKLVDSLGPLTLGQYDGKSSISLIKNFGTVADLATIFLHELCHFALKIDDSFIEHQTIYKAQISAMNAVCDRAKEENKENPYSNRVWYGQLAVASLYLVPQNQWIGHLKEKFWK